MAPTRLQLRRRIGRGSPGDWGAGRGDASRSIGDGNNNDGIFLKNCWYVAAWDHELIDGKQLARTILEKPVVLYKGESGRVVALEDRCCHRGAPLSMGRIEGDCMRCMYHGMKFEPSGKCIQIPGQDIIPPKLGVRSYPVVERDHLVWIWMGDPAQADPSLIVDYPPLHDPGWSGHAGLHALRRELAADRRQPERLRASRVRAHQDARRLRGVRVSRPSRSTSSAWPTASASSAGT